MLVLGVQFRGFMGFGAKRGRIEMISPGKVLNLRRSEASPGKAIIHPLELKWSGFPRGKVGRMDLISEGRQDILWAQVYVNGRERGGHSGRIQLWQAETENQVRVDGFNLKGKRLFQTSGFPVQIEILENEVACPVVASTATFMAQILKVVRHESYPGSKVPVAVWFKVQNVPAGTDSLSLESAGSQTRTQPWKGPGDYGFFTYVSAAHAGLIGKPAGKSLSINTVLQARSSGLVLAKTEGSFTLEQIVG